MSTISHEPPATLARKWSWIDARNMWTSIAIVAIWLAVLFTAVFGPDIKTVTAGGDSSTVPSAVAVALFAVFGTWAVARFGFEKTKDS